MDEIYEFGSKVAFRCSGCGKTEGGFMDRVAAQVALRLHKIGCKKS
jgi:hypothetical protein